MTVVAATDGAAIGNPGPGGWAWVTEAGDQDWASVRQSTNNRMELIAVLELLLSTAPDQPLRVLTDSQYVRNIFTEWLANWKERGWRTAQGRPVENRDLIEAIDGQLQDRTVAFEWVQGHAGHPLNEKANALAQHAAQRAQRAVTTGVFPERGKA